MSPDTAKWPWEGRIPQVRTNGLINISTLSSLCFFNQKWGGRRQGNKLYSRLPGPIKITNSQNLKIYRYFAADRITQNYVTSIF